MDNAAPSTRNRGRLRPVLIAVFALSIIVPALMAAGRIHTIRPTPLQEDPSRLIERVGDYYHFWTAARAMSRGEDIFEMSDGKNYIYPPLTAFLFQPLGMLPQKAGAYLWLGVIALMMGAAILLWARELLRRFVPEHDDLAPWVVSAIASFLMFDKIHQQFRLLQTDGVMLLCMAISLRLIDRRPILAGALLGFAGNIKYLSLIPLPYLIVRGRWRASAAVAASFVFFLFLPAVSSGWSRNLADLAVAFRGLVEAFGIDVGDAARASSHPITWDRSVSITSTMFRIVGEDGSRAVGAALTAAAAAACLGAGYLLYRRRNMPLFHRLDVQAEAGGARAGLVGIEWVGLVIASLVFGPQTTSRHMVQLLPLIILGLGLLLVPRFRRDFWMIGAGIVLVSLALVLPPGQVNEGAVRVWRAVGGVSWCALILLFVAVDCGLKVLAERGSPAPRPAGRERDPQA